MKKPDHELNKAEFLVIESFRTTDGPVNLSEIRHPRIKEAFEELYGRYITGTIGAAFYIPHPERNKEKNLKRDTSSWYKTGSFSSNSYCFQYLFSPSSFSSRLWHLCHYYFYFHFCVCFFWYWFWSNNYPKQKGDYQ